MLKERLREALARSNPELPEAAIEEALRQVLTPENPALIENNRRFHHMLTDGVDVSWMEPEGVQHGKVWLLDVEHPENNDWLAVNQFTVIENRRERRPDIVLFLNGLPLVVMDGGLAPAAAFGPVMKEKFEVVQAILHAAAKHLQLSHKRPPAFFPLTPPTAPSARRTPSLKTD